MLKSRPGSRGSALIGLVVAILVFSVLAAAIVPMVSSSGRQVSAANSAANAYLMAESGFRYGASRYLHAGASDSQKNNILENLEGRYALDGGKHAFDLKVFSFFYEILDVDNITAPSQITIKAHSPGTFPIDQIPSIEANLKIRIDDDTYDLKAGSQPFPGQDDNVTLVVNTTVSTFPKGTIIYPVASAALSNPVQTLGSGEDKTHNIVCEPNHTSMFPLRNGRIRVAGNYRTYRYNDRDTNRLIDIRNPDSPYAPLPDFTIPVGQREIVLAPYVRLESTGIHGSGNAETRRTVVYHTPLALSQTATVQKTFTDTFEDKNDWQDTDGNQTQIGDVDGNSALKVDNATAITLNGETVQGSLTKFNPTTPEALSIDFRGARRGTQGYLSYETQIKIGYEGANDPFWDFFVGAGLSFRLKDLPQTDATIFNVNTYGISFIRGTEILNDGIPDEYVPNQDKRIIVLWQQTANGADRKWLAYKEMADVFFDQNLEAGNPFTQIPVSGWSFIAGGPPRNGTTNHWHIPGNLSGTIQSTIITLPDSIETVLTFWSWHRTEPDQLKQVYLRDVATDTTMSIRTIDNRDDETGWYQERLEIPDFFMGKEIRVEFNLDTPTDPANIFEGWYIDDVRVFHPWPAQEATLAVRLQEALVVPFNGGTVRIRQGDRIYGSTHFTTGTVMSPPLLTGGNWTIDAEAQGVFLIDRVASTAPGPAFEDAENLLVLGGSGKARVDNYSESTDRRANIIRAYCAAATGSGTRSGNGDPLDRNTAPYGRLGKDPDLITLQWPPDLDGDGNWTDDDGNWTDEEDYFRLLQWEAVNGAIDPQLTVDTIDFTSKDQGLVTDAVIQTRHPDLESPLIFGPLTSNPELGLHAFGNGALNVFFDDFGIRLDVSVEDALPAPVQQ